MSEQTETAEYFDEIREQQRAKNQAEVDRTSRSIEKAYGLPKRQPDAFEQSRIRQRQENK